MADFLRNKNEYPKLKQFEIADRLGYSSSTLQSYRNDINMLSPYRIQSNKTNKRTKKTLNTNSDNNSHIEHDLKRPRLTSFELKRPQTTSDENVKSLRSKNELKGGANVEINDQYLDEILHNNNP